MKYSILLFVVIFAMACTDENNDLTSNEKTLDLASLGSSPTREDIGRVLFYDSRLSLNNSVACASCHKQTMGFADNKQLSTGFEGHLALRNSPSIDHASQHSLFWDGRESNLFSMVLLPLTNHVEMGMSDNDAVVQRVSNAGYYKDLFQKVYFDNDITISRISECLKSFVGSITNDESKFNKEQQNQAQFSALEDEGRQLFFDIYPCGSCHHPNSTSPYGAATLTSFSDIGLDNTPVDAGRGAITNTTSDNGKFKIPGLKNVAITGPYMHDGRFNTLEDVLEHYSTGVMNSANLDDRLKDANGNPLVLNITDQQKKALVAFLSTMTDFNTLTDPKLSDPFDH